MNGSNISKSTIPRTRVRTGCITCRSRKVKCDEQRPQCGNCLRLEKICIYKDGRARKSRDLSGAGIVVVPSQDFQGDTRTSPASGRNNSQQTTSTRQRQNSSSQSASSHIMADDIFIDNELLQQPLPQTLPDQVFDPWDPLTHFLPTYETPLDTGLHFSLDSTDREAHAVGRFPWMEAFQVPDHSFPTTQPESQGDVLFSYFREHVNPPYLRNFDPIAWKRIRNYIAQLGTRSEAVGSAIVALEVLCKAESAKEDVGVGMTHYYTAKSSHRKMLEDTEDYDILLVATFLLCCFEMIAPSEAISITLQSDGPFVKKLQRRVRSWSPISRKIISWLIVFRGKAMHLGGRGILSRKVHQLLIVDSDLGSDLGLTDHADPEEILAEALSASLYTFHMDTQRISPLIAGLDRHHRSRDSAEDEIATQADAERIRLMLQELWLRRPRVFDLSQEALQANLSSRVVEHLTDLVRTYKANFLGEVIYLGRARADTPQANMDSQEAMASLRTIIGDGRIHDGLFWPLFMYALESLNIEETQWAVERIRSADDPMSHSETLATLASQLAEAQLLKGERIDTRYFSIETFGGPPPFI